ncbi:MAG: transporter substrate-binding domain-containing protein [Clostridium sp.]
MNQKGKVFLLILIILLIFNPLLVEAKNPNKVIRIGGDNNYPPYEFVDTNNVYKGFNVDIMRAAAAEVGYDIEFVPLKWSEAIRALENGEVDAIQGMNKIEDREKKFIFSESYAASEQVIFTLKDTVYISNINDLKGKKVSIQTGDIAIQILSGIDNIDIRTFQNQDQALNELYNGKVDAFIGNKIVGLYYVQKEDKLDKVKITGTTIFKSEYSLATTSDKREIISLFNKGLKDIKDKGIYKQIDDRWFGVAVGYSQDKWRGIVNTFIIIIFLVVGVVVATLFTNNTLKNKIVDGTRELEEVYKVIAGDEERYKSFIESCPDAIFSHNFDNEIIFINDEGRRLLGASSKDEIIGRSMKEFTPDMAYVEEVVGSYFSGKTVYNRTVRRIDGGLIDVEIRGSFIIHSGKESVISIVRDIGDRKKLYEAIEYDRVKTEFFSNISHELRTPLNVILASLQLMETKTKKYNHGDIGIDINKNINSIRHNGHRLLRLVNNLIDITKIDSGYISLNMTNGNIIDVIENAVTAVIEYAQVKNIEVTFDTDSEEIIMAFDEDKIERIMLNLLSNAVKFSEANGSILVDIKKSGDKVIISVEDNGVGIPKDKLGVVFERFRQVNKTLTRSFEGSGIGLSLVKSLVEMQNGEIKVDSIVDKGSTFTVYLPIKILDEEEENSSRSLMAENDMVEIEFSDLT